MKIDTTNLLELYEKADNEAIKIFKMHLQFMYKHRGKKFDKILNCMGSTAFYKNNEPLYQHEKELLKGYNDLIDFLNEWEMFKLTGYPIQVDKNGLKEM